jgi:hypothetical protein
MKQIFAIIISFSMIFTPCLAHADSEIVTLEKGESAPFSGTLFNTEAAATLLADLETQSKSCDIKIESAVLKNQAAMQFKLDLSEARLKIYEDKYTEILKIKTDQNEFLKNEISKRKTSRDVTFIVGVALGITASVASAYALSAASQ